jgi:nucleobase transporter 1/2
MERKKIPLLVNKCQSNISTLKRLTIFRLPIVQGGTFAFLAPTFAILSLPANQCPSDFSVNGWGNMSDDLKTEEWQRRMREVQGAIAVSAIFQVAIGYLGQKISFFFVFNHFFLTIKCATA